MSAPPNSPPEPSRKLSPILGLPIDDAPSSLPASPSASDPSLPEPTLQLSVIIPARNEEHNLPACLASLLAQSDDFFLLGRDWELLVVDDNSTDATRSLATALAGQHPGLRVLHAPELELGTPGNDTQRAFTGKTQACWLAAQQAQGRWLLFTDADTLHEPGNLLRALREAERNNVALLSYSPRQIVDGLVQHALMPLIFSELSAVYPPAQVNDPAKRAAAANGQFILIDRAVYFAVGGHRAVGRSVLEDVDLARNVKRAAPRHQGRSIRLRYAADALSTRMYAGIGDLIEGWTKNLVLLFPHALSLAGWRLLDIVLLLLPVVYIVFPHLTMLQNGLLLLIWLRTVYRFYSRVARSNFGFVDCAISPLALPLFIYLLVRSWMNHNLFHQVAWKGRDYRTGR